MNNRDRCNERVKGLRVLYTHKYINNNSNTNTYTNTGGFCSFGYERVYQCLASVLADTRRETQFLKAYANHTMLTPTLPHHRAAHLVVFKISASRDPKNSTATFNNQPQLTDFSKFSNSQGHLLWA